MEENPEFRAHSPLPSDLARDAATSPRQADAECKSNFYIVYGCAFLIVFPRPRNIQLLDLLHSTGGFSSKGLRRFMRL